MLLEYVSHSHESATTYEPVVADNTEILNQNGVIESLEKTLKCRNFTPYGHSNNFICI
jgi:hypothetical protein